MAVLEEQVVGRAPAPQLEAVRLCILKKIIYDSYCGYEIRKFGDIIRIARVVFGPAVEMVLSSHISYDTIAVWPGLLVL